MRLLVAGEVWDADSGVKPLSEDFTSDAFVSMLDGRGTPIQTFLVDQRHLSASETSMRARLWGRPGLVPIGPARKITRPARPASRGDPRRSAPLTRATVLGLRAAGGAAAAKIQNER